MNKNPENLTLDEINQILEDKTKWLPPNKKLILEKRKSELKKKNFVNEESDFPSLITSKQINLKSSNCWNTPNKLITSGANIPKKIEEKKEKPTAPVQNTKLQQEYYSDDDDLPCYDDY